MKPHSLRGESLGRRMATCPAALPTGDMDQHLFCWHGPRWKNLPDFAKVGCGSLSSRGCCWAWRAARAAAARRRSGDCPTRCSTLVAPPPDPSLVDLRLDGASLVHDVSEPDGWNWSSDAHTSIRFFGRTCDVVRASTGGSRLVPPFGCPAPGAAVRAVGQKVAARPNFAPVEVDLRDDRHAEGAAREHAQGGAPPAGGAVVAVAEQRAGRCDGHGGRRCHGRPHAPSRVSTDGTPPCGAHLRGGSLVR